MFRPPAGRSRTPRLGASTPTPPSLSETRGAHHRGQVLWQEPWASPCSSSCSRPAGTQSVSWGSPPPNSTGQRPCPAPPLPAPEARDGVHAFLRTQEITALAKVCLARLRLAPPDDPRGPRALSPSPDRELWRSGGAGWLTASRPSAGGWPPTPDHPEPSPPPAPPPPPQDSTAGTAHGTPQKH